MVPPLGGDHSPPAGGGEERVGRRALAVFAGGDDDAEREHEDGAVGRDVEDGAHAASDSRSRVAVSAPTMTALATARPLTATVSARMTPSSRARFPYIRLWRVFASKVPAPRPSSARPASSSETVFAPVNGRPGPAGPVGADEDAPPTAEVLLACWPVVAPDVVVAPEVLVAPEELVAPEVVVVVVPGMQPVTQNTLCLVSAPCEPSAWIVSLTWKPW